MNTICNSSYRGYSVINLVIAPIEGTVYPGQFTTCSLSYRIYLYFRIIYKNYWRQVLFLKFMFSSIFLSHFIFPWSFYIQLRWSRKFQIWINLSILVRERSASVGEHHSSSGPGRPRIIWLIVKLQLKIQIKLYFNMYMYTKSFIDYCLLSSDVHRYFQIKSFFKGNLFCCTDKFLYLSHHSYLLYSLFGISNYFPLTT